jgi:hypothetical protein
MKPSPIIVLFGEPPPLRRGPSGFAISILVHACACVLLYLGLNQARKVDSRLNNERYAVRIMELHTPEPKKQRVAQNPLPDPGQQPKTQPTTSGGGQQTAAAPRIPINFVAQKQAIQTLVQPDAPDLTIPQETPLPQIAVWSSRELPVKKIVQPAPETVTKIEVQPTLEAPNQEVRVADLKISASPFDTKAPLPTPSKTSPVNISAPTQTQHIPETASKDAGRAAPASVISLSDIKQEGTATLPMINEVAPAPFTGSLTAGQPKGLSQTGHGKTEGKENGAGTGRTSGDDAGKAVGASGPAGQGGTNGQSGVEASVTSGTSQPTVVHINLPKDGKFAVVVVGSSLAEDYPETSRLWSGRLAYTVFLHVGTAKNWVLQYSLPRALQAAAAGNVARPDAPWPYDITRPSIDADANTDAIMVHGFVNTAGRFEQLAVIFPTELAEAKFLLHILQQWQFRPSMQNGQATAVEVLLIIPDQAE